MTTGEEVAIHELKLEADINEIQPDRTWLVSFLRTMQQLLPLMPQVNFATGYLGGDCDVGNPNKLRVLIGPQITI